MCRYIVEIINDFQGALRYVIFLNHRQGCICIYLFVLHLILCSLDKFLEMSCLVEGDVHFKKAFGKFTQLPSEMSYQLTF